jgi:hypothetical protein
MLKSSRTLSKEEQAIMVNIEPIYEAWLSEKQQEVHRETIAGMLIAKFGTMDPELENVIPKLINLDPTQRAQLIMTLSREALLESQ